MRKTKEINFYNDSKATNVDATITALKSFDKITNSNLYVTLEPCSHYGKTPPCVNKIINKKIKKVFFSVHDPDLRSYNKSSNILKRKGIKVKSYFFERLV